MKKARNETINSQQARWGWHVKPETFLASAASGLARSDCRCLPGGLVPPCRVNALSALSSARRRLTRAKPYYLFALEAATRATRLAGTWKLKLHKTGNGA